MGEGEGQFLEEGDGERRGRVRMWSLGAPGQSRGASPTPRADPRPSPTGRGRTSAQGSGQRRGHVPATSRQPPISRQFALTHSFGVRHRLWTFNHEQVPLNTRTKGGPTPWVGGGVPSSPLSYRRHVTQAAPIEPLSLGSKTGARELSEGSEGPPWGPRRMHREGAQGGGCSTGPPTAGATSLISPCPPPSPPGLGLRPAFRHALGSSGAIGSPVHWPLEKAGVSSSWRSATGSPASCSESSVWNSSGKACS